MATKNFHAVRAVKLALRITHDRLDSDIESEVEACRADLTMHGITYAADSDPLILNAVKLWARSVFTDDTAKAAEWLTRYKALRDSLKQAEGYGWRAEDE